MDGHEIPFELVSLLVLVLVSAIVGIWRAASLKADMNEKWGRRVKLAKAGLDEAAHRQLVGLRRQLDDFFASDGQLDRAAIVADPSYLRNSVGEFQKCFNTRDKLDRRFGVLLSLGPVLTWGLIALALSLIATILYLIKLYSYQWVIVTTIVMGAISLSTCLVILILYIYTQQRLATAELMADSMGEGNE